MHSRLIVKDPSATTIPGHYILVAIANQVSEEIFWHNLSIIKCGHKQQLKVIKAWNTHKL